MQNNRLALFSKLVIKDALGKRYPVRSALDHLEATIDWLISAQNVQTNGGVSAHFSFVKGWAPSFIETTGYIIKTFLEANVLFPTKHLAKRAAKMAQFILSVQLPEGGYRTYVPSQMASSEPTTFNTAQDILGLCDFYEFSKKKLYLQSAVKAAQFLHGLQNKDGSWTDGEENNTPRSYHSRVGWALIRVGQLARQKKLILAGKKSLAWVLKQQSKTGWFKFSQLPGFNEPYPITHTLAYTMEGLLYGGLALGEKKYAIAALKTAQKLLNVYRRDGQLFATYDQHWQPQSRYVCLTGNAQITKVWLDLDSKLRLKTFTAAALSLNAFLKSLHNTLDKKSPVYGGVKGSHPIYGSIWDNKGYCRLAFINWGAKFFADSLLAEHRLATRGKL